MRNITEPEARSVRIIRMSKSAKRLFYEFEPEHYDLELLLDNEKMTFEGTVTIAGKKTGRPSQRLTFHQKNLNVTEAKITKHDKKGTEDIVVDRINHHKSFYEVRLHAKQMLYPGRYTVTMKFKGKITEQMTGIYPCVFEHDGQKKKLIATQFESHHAREAFPCIDEPEAKATFQLSLVTPKDGVVLSNTPVESQKTENGKQRTIFELTPRMSTYLLAFVMGEMHCVERKTKDGIEVRSWASVAQPARHLDYSANEAVKVLEFFTDYFGTPYPLKKCDQVALPDFDAGAMENWGLITYREIALLTDPKNPSISTEQYISLVVAHELSHQWFGNLVTMKWWDDLWLNESFASIMEHLVLDTLHPDWQQWEMYASTDIVSTSSRDIYSDIQPVSVEVTDPDLLHTLFDPGIVYAKGGRLLKMLQDYIGDEAFRKGLQAYFKKHAYGNTTREDLWEALGKASGHDISALLTPWIIQPGMPMVQVTQKDKKLHISQERYLLDAKDEVTIWPLPMLSSISVTPDLIDTPSAEATLESGDYAIINQHGSGHYFTYYTEPKHREFLADALEKLTIPPETRINLLNDIYMLARHGGAPLTDALDLIVNSVEEPRDNVWSLVFRIVNTANQLTEGHEPSEKCVKQLRVALARHWYPTLGWDAKPSDDPNTLQLRHSMLSLMIAGEDKSAIKQALEIYNSTPDPHDINAELRNTILVTAVRHGDKQVMDTLMKQYKSASPDLQLDITSALAANRDPEAAAKILTKGIGKGGFVRTQDLLRWIAMFMRNYYVRSVTWDFMLKNWPYIVEQLENSKSYDFLPVYCASVVSTEDWTKKYHDFFEPLKSNKSLTRNILVGYADIDARVAWRKRDEAKVKQWLKQHTSKD
jgi:aminopeptidase N